MIGVSGRMAPTADELQRTRERHVHTLKCRDFCEGVTIPEGPDAPKLSGVLESLSWATALLSLRESTWEPGGPAETAFKKARTLLAAFQPVEPEETSDGR